jgi:cytochrome c6
MKVVNRIFQSTFTVSTVRKWTSIAVITITAILASASPALSADYFKGREVYGLHCEGCHGADGRSDQPGVPDFSSGDALVQSDSEIFKKLREGSETMPAYRGILTESEVRAVIAYLRSLQK